MEQNRLITPPKNIVDPAGRAVTSDERMKVTFEKCKRMVIDRKRSNGTSIDFTTVYCNSRAIAWIIDVPPPPNLPVNAPVLCVWGFFSPEGEQILGRGLPREVAEKQATDFAKTAALNEIQNQIEG